MTILYCFLDSDEYARLAPSVENADTVLVPLACENWNRDLSPWPAKKVFSKGENFSGGADVFLRTLVTSVIPQKERELGIVPDRRFIAGYSLAGLFSLYAALETELFDGAASVSGSLWFDGFTDYVRQRPLPARLKRVFFSVGDREKNAREPRMATVEDRTREISAMLANRGVETVFELNPGGHFNEPEARIKKGLDRLVFGSDGK